MRIIVGLEYKVRIVRINVSDMDCYTHSLPVSSMVKGSTSLGIMASVCRRFPGNVAYRDISVEVALLENKIEIYDARRRRLLLASVPHRLIRLYSRSSHFAHSRAILTATSQQIKEVWSHLSSLDESRRPKEFTC